MKPLIHAGALVNVCAWQTFYLSGFVMAASASEKPSVRGLGEIVPGVNNLDSCNSFKGKSSAKD
jgi:hypothetical protein